MKIKKGDKVKILIGKDKGKIGKVMQIFTSRRKASVEGLNLLIKHIRPRREGEKGQRVEFPSPLDLSNLMFICSRCGKPVRIGYKYKEIGDKNKKRKKVRICKKCGKTVD